MPFPTFSLPTTNLEDLSSLPQPFLRETPHTQTRTPRPTHRITEVTLAQMKPAISYIPPAPGPMGPKNVTTLLAGPCLLLLISIYHLQSHEREFLFFLPAHSFSFLPFHHSTWHSWAHLLFICAVCMYLLLLSTRDQFMKNTVYIIYVYIYLFKLLCLKMCFVSGAFLHLVIKTFHKTCLFLKHSGPGPSRV